MPRSPSHKWIISTGVHLSVGQQRPQQAPLLAATASSSPFRADYSLFSPLAPQFHHHLHHHHHHQLLPNRGDTFFGCGSSSDAVAAAGTTSGGRGFRMSKSGADGAAAATSSGKTSDPGSAGDRGAGEGAAKGGAEGGTRGGSSGDFPLVTLDPDATQKFAEIEVEWGDNDSSEKTVLIRGLQSAAYHIEAAEPTMERLRQAGSKATITGGGRIKHSSERRSIFIYGYSTQFGPANLTRVADLCRKQYPSDFEVTWSEGGY